MAHLANHLVVVPVALVDGLCVHLLPVQDTIVVCQQVPVVIVEPRGRRVERSVREVRVRVAPRSAILHSKSSRKTKTKNVPNLRKVAKKYINLR